MKKLLLTITALTLGLSIIPIHGAAERKRKAESQSLEAPAAKKQKTVDIIALSASLKQAIDQLDVQAVIKALDNGADAGEIIEHDQENPNELTKYVPLEYLFKVYRDFDIWEKFKKSGISVNNAEDAIARALIEHGADVNATIDDEPLISLSINSDADNLAQWRDGSLLKILIKSGARVDQPDANGRTALMKAAEENDATSFIILLNAGADLTIRDNAGHDVLYYVDNALSKEDLHEIIKKHREAISKASKE